MSAPWVFLCSGQGSQYLQMGVDLYRHDPVFREWVLRLDRVATPLIGTSVVGLLYGDGRSGAPLPRALHSNASIFTVEYALARSLMARGLEPAMTLGVSLGEIVAAAIAGIYEPEAALEACVRLARAVEGACEAGGMLAVLHDPALMEREPGLFQGVEYAGRNDAFQFVVSGRVEALRAVDARLQARGITTFELPVAHAFHSSYMDPARERYLADLRSLPQRPARIPVVSGLDGGIRRELPPEHLWGAIRGPMAFSDAVRGLMARGEYAFIDVGPSSSLANLLKAGVAKSGRPAVFSVMTPAHGEVERLKQLERSFVPPPAVSSPPLQHEKKSMIAYVFPGQGTQRKGMGARLFEPYRSLTDKASEILGYSIEELCLQNPDNRLGQTQYTQPALYVVNALSYLEKKAKDGEPDFVAGHSLGEYNALFAAGSFDFETGLRLVKRRGEIMAEAKGGGMAAVVGLSRERIEEVLRSSEEFGALDVANFNTPNQVVIAGPADVVQRASPAFEAAGAKAYVLLKVSAAFHSRYMAPASETFRRFLAGFDFQPPRIPVISNVEARPYEAARCRELLAIQIARPVNWTGTVRYLLAQPGMKIVEVGPGIVLANMLRDFEGEAPSAPVAAAPVPTPPPAPSAPEVSAPVAPPPAAPEPRRNGVPRHESREAAPVATEGFSAQSLGSAEFRADHGIKYAYVAGAMYRGVASKEMVVAMGKAGMLGYFGSGGVPLRDTEAAILHIQRELSRGQAYGINLLSSPQNPQLEEDTVDLFLRHGVRHIEAASYMAVTSALVRYRLVGLERDARGNVVPKNRIVAKVSRPEIAEAFLRPAPERLVRRLVEQRRITPEQAEWSQRVPLADDLCVEADSGGHTDQGVAYALTPAIIRLRDRMMAQYGYAKRVRVGAAGGIGTPEAAAAAFMLGADFILTGSINQCTVEAGTSNEVKELLQGLNVQDFDYAPAGDLFELGARVQVVKKGLFFSARANKLYDLYRFHDSLEQIDAKTREHLQTAYFRKSFDAVYEDVKAYYPPSEIEKAEALPKYKMALIFKWYFGYSTRLALGGSKDSRIDYQVHSGPALGAFNQWVKGTPMERWENRRVAEIGELLMQQTAQVITDRMRAFGALPRGNVHAAA
ncbi:ACP S-malonyltransferase [Corallococcus macrosporus]|nr:ACP S-malonyltransferase [Corallococcus macrosporus]